MRNTFPQKMEFGHQIKPKAIKKKIKKKINGALPENIVKAESLHGFKKQFGIFPGKNVHLQLLYEI